MIACSGSKPRDEERKGRQGSKAKGFSMVFMDQLWAPEIGFKSSNDNMDIMCPYCIYYVYDI